MVRSIHPDVLCFLESKTDMEHLLQLDGFENWLLQTGYKYVYCYWSRKDNCESTYGNEGIILFSKVRCSVTYGLNVSDMDVEARVLTAQFSDCIMVFTYNPQGGFVKQSLEFRFNWETALKQFLRNTVQQAKSKNKKLIWAGDFNVNPTVDDWSERAFDRIKHKIPEGTVIAGCREEDQRIYRELVAELDGVNVAEHFKKNSRRTCFPTEKCLRLNAGQRIDHVVVEKGLLDGSALRVSAFETMQQFGGSKKGSSDHCPLWFRLERGTVKMIPALPITREQIDLDSQIVKQIENLMTPLRFRYNEMQMSDEFLNVDSDDEREEEDVCHVEDDDNQQRPFEDCPMPILKCCVHASGDILAVKMLIDSGSALDLVSEATARKLQRKGCVSQPRASKSELLMERRAY